MPAKKRAKMQMTDEHKAALAVGRNEGRAVRRYLEALEASRPKRGRKRTADTITKRLAAIDDEIATADALKAVMLRQEKLNLEAELATAGEGVDLAELEAGFVAAARGYSERKGISYAAWRASGVPAAVLSAAGIPRRG